MVLNVILAILVLSIIVIVHEFGHFIIAKANGITVVEFSIGFGPKLIHFRKGETEYCIKALPFGGACTMLGDEFLEMSVIQSEEDDDLLIVNKPQDMVVHPAPGNYENTLVNAILYHCKDNGRYESDRIL